MRGDVLDPVPFFEEQLLLPRAARLGWTGTIEEVRGQVREVKNSRKFLFQSVPLYSEIAGHRPARLDWLNEP